jgi:hypothetical protein
MMPLTHTLTQPVPRGTEIYVGTCTQAEWDLLLEERIAIMHESGLTSARALALGLADTERAHGSRPKGDA